MLIPYGSDAPIYHWPFATGALILLNIMVYAIQCSVPDAPYTPSDNVVDVDDVEFDYSDDEPSYDLDDIFYEGDKPGWYGYALTHGDGLHPIQWVTSSIMHMDLFHLIGNMIFLWAFGLVVEGRVGPLKFVLLFFGMGIIQNSVEQVLFLWASPSISLGASSVIYGLMMICMLWNPQDNLLSVMIIFIYFIHVRVPLSIFALFYFLWDFGAALFTGFEMSTPLLHIMGGFVGTAVGAGALMLQRVDCEDRDLLSMFREMITGNPRPKNYRKKKKTEQELKEQEEAVVARDQRIQLLYRSIDQHLGVGNSQAAIKSFRDLKRLGPKNDWNQNSLLKLINLLQAEKRWGEVVVYCRHYIERFQPMRDVVRLNLARIYVTQTVSPRKALSVLNDIDQTQLNDKQKQLFTQIAVKSKQLIADGVLEVRDD